MHKSRSNGQWGKKLNGHGASICPFIIELAGSCVCNLFHAVRSLLSTQPCFQLVFCFHHLKSEAMPSKEKYRVILVCLEDMDGSKRFLFSLSGGLLRRVDRKVDSWTV